MKLTLKVFLIVSLFCSTAFAEGDMGSGGFVEGDMGSGGITCTENCPTEPQTTIDPADEKTTDEWILDFIQDYLMKMFE